MCGHPAGEIFSYELASEFINVEVKYSLFSKFKINI